MPQILFIPVKDNHAKIIALCRIVEMHFEQKKKLLIVAPSAEAANYIDQLLWKYKEESFLPHTIIDSQTSEPIGITTKMENLNRASSLLNLCPSAVPIFESFENIYELFDETMPDKAELSRQRQQTYVKQGCKINFL